MIKKLDADQQRNADALEALGVEYPIEKRYLITESQLRAVNEALSDAQSFYEMFDGYEGVEEREATLAKADTATENLDPAGGCEHWHRTCEVCGVFPVLEGWISDDTYFCDPCGEARTTEFYTDAAGVEHTGLTMSQCWELIEKDHPDNDFFYWTSWPLEDDDCTQDGPCDCRCWLCMKYPAKGLA